MKTIHIEGIAIGIDICEKLSDNYNLESSFDFEDDSDEVIPNCFIRIYRTDDKCSLEDAIRGYTKYIFGDVVVNGQQYGYSEYTIEGFNVHSAEIGGHNIQEIIDSFGDKYIHILIDQNIERTK